MVIEQMKRRIILAILRGAEPFFLPGGRHGALVIHGFTGSPSEMRLLGEDLNQKGYSVMGPRLSGHGTCAEEMADTAWPHWYSSVEDGFLMLKSLCDKVSVIGLSMGGLLALKLASEYSVCKVVSINTPIYIADKRLPLLPIYSLIREFIPKKRGKLNVDPSYNVCYDRTPLKSLTSLTKLIKQVDGLLASISAPLLVIQSRHEHTVRPESARHIYEGVGSSDKRLVWLERSGHIATLDKEHKQVFSLIHDFLLGKVQPDEEGNNESR